MDLHRCTVVLQIMLCACAWGQSPGTRLLECNGYQGCIELSNERTRVVLEPNCGGRVLVYALDGKNALYVDPNQDGWVYDGTGRVDPAGGRFDIGPEHTIPRHDGLWLGQWTAEITGPRSARMISPEDPVLGIQLIRAFSLAFKSSHLRCTQIIKNLTDEPKRYCYRSRTLVAGGGIGLVPLNPCSRFPKGYLLCGPGDTICFRPGKEDPIRVREGILEVTGPPSQPTLAMDADQGWIAYLMHPDLLFLKRFPVQVERIYGEVTGHSMSIRYATQSCCELESIGPWDVIDPGKSLAFRESWWLVDHPFPQDRPADLSDIKARIAQMQP